MTVKLNLARINSIRTTMEAIERTQKLIDFYSEDKSGPAYVTCKNVVHENVELQIDRKIMVNALTEQMNKLILSIEDRYGFEYDPDADWIGDKREV